MMLVLSVTLFSLFNSELGVIVETRGLRFHREVNKNSFSFLADDCGFC